MSITQELIKEWRDSMIKKQPKPYGIYESVLIGDTLYSKNEIMEMLNRSGRGNDGH